MLCLHDVDPLNICMKKYDCQKIIFDKTTAMRTWAIFLSFFFTGKGIQGPINSYTSVFDGTTWYYAYVIYTLWTFA